MLDELKTQAIDWDAFSQAVKDYEDDVPIIRRLSHAANTAIRLHEICAEDPVPDKHLFNLWESREELHQAYLRNGRLYSNLIRVRGKTAHAKRYAKRLSRSRWFEHCASFDERTGLKKLWYTYRALWGKTKTPNIAHNILIAANLPAKQLEKEAANYSFLNLACTPQVTITLQKKQATAVQMHPSQCRNFSSLLTLSMNVAPRAKMA